MSKKKSKVELNENESEVINENIVNENDAVEVKIEKQSETTDQANNGEQKYIELNDKYLRLSAEFDNFRRRSLKEKMELIKTAGEDILLNILPVMDNFERALKAIDGNAEGNNSAIKEGVLLIYTNFKEFLSQRGVKELDSIGKEFDTDHHEAITKIPAPNEEMKGKVIDVIEKGYMMHEKIIRFAKVVVGE